MSTLNKSPQLTEAQYDRFNEVLNLAQTCGYEEEHTQQVARLALQIFDQLRGLTNFGQEEKFFLLCAAFLHDIGISVEGTRGHHKVAQRIILSTPLLHFSSKERLIIANIARYHRKALPSEQHSHYRALNTREQHLVNILSGILRIADGLDYRHDNRVEHIDLVIDDHSIAMQCAGNRKKNKLEIASAMEKSDLLANALGRSIQIS